MRESIRNFLRRFPAITTKRGAVILVVAAVPAAIYFAAQLTVPASFPVPASADKPGIAAVRAEEGPEAAPVPLVTHVSTPDFVKGIYVTAATVSSSKRFAALVDLIGRTELNAMVIDLKDGGGPLAFAPQTAELRPFAESRPPIGDLAAFTKPLHDKHIYLIARVFVFEDPSFASKRPDLAVRSSGGGIWRDRRGVMWLDPAATDVWRYNAAIAKEAYANGFDEVQFDYIRFPTDGNLKALSFPVYDGKKPKADAIADFFAFLDAELRQKAGIPISADLFGLTMAQHHTDLGIGQRLDTGARHFDFISPMVYPSHYASGFDGFANPADHPYEVIYDNMVRGQEVFAALKKESDAARAQNPQAGFTVATARPWIQDFNLGATYTAAMVRAEMKAVADGGGSGWLIWNAGNVYTESAFGPKTAD